MTPARDRVSRLPEALMLAASLLILIAIAVAAHRSSADAQKAEDEQKLAQTVMLANAGLLSALRDAETGQRGFLLTGRDEYLDPYRQGTAAISQLLTLLTDATAGNAEQTARLENMRPLVQDKLAELQSTIDLRRSNRTAEALQVVDTDRGKNYMDQLRAISAEMERIENSRLDRFERQEHASAAALRDISVGGAALMGAFVLISAITVFRGMARRDALFRQTYAGEKLLNTTLSGIADGVIATDSQACVTFINPIAAALTGWTESDALSQPIENVLVIVHETTRAPAKNPLQEALAKGVAVGLANHTNLISKSGAEIPIDDSAAPLKDADGAIIGAVLVFRDISDRRRAERQLESANAELQQFVDAAAHDLRSPVNSVASLAQLLAAQYGRSLGSNGSELLEHIRAGLARVQRLLDDLLTFARAAHPDEPESIVSLEAALQTALQNLKLEIDSNRATIAAGPLPRVVIHETNAIQLFQNLIGNAIKYRREEAPHVRIDARQSGGSCTIAIADNGLGIEPEYLDQIFRPFKRLHGDEVPGSGIGLATCEKIARNRGGRIWVESKPGEGSTFFVTLRAPDGE